MRNAIRRFNEEMSSDNSRHVIEAYEDFKEEGMSLELAMATASCILGTLQFKADELPDLVEYYREDVRLSIGLNLRNKEEGVDSRIEWKPGEV